MRICTLFILVWLMPLIGMAQDGAVSITPVFDEDYVNNNLCGAVTNLVTDAAKGFAKAKGKEIQTVGAVTMWTSNIGLPGASTSSLLFTTSWQYEGVVYQGAAAGEWKRSYQHYKKLLKSCLTEKGYEEVTEPNAADGLDAYPEIIFKRPSGDAPSVTLKLEKAEAAELYTLTINVWQAGR